MNELSNVAAFYQEQTNIAGDIINSAYTIAHAFGSFKLNI